MAVKMPKATDLAGPSQESLSVVGELAKRQVAMEDEIARIEATLAEKNKALYKLKTIDLPTAMEAAGVKFVGLPDGTKVEVTDFVTGNIKEENRTAAHKWLRDNGFGSLIKNTIALAFGMGEEKKCGSIAAYLEKRRIPFDRKEAVNTQTLRAFVRERLQAGKALPPSIDITSVPTSKITRSKDHG